MDGLERWRGAVDEKLAQLKAGQDALPEQLDRLGDRLEGALLQHAADDRRTFGEHDGRIKTLELAKATVDGRTAVIVVLLSLLASSVSAALVSHFLLK